jgi:signal transducing adaptor molecule
MPELSATELAKEAEQEAAVFAQAMNVEKLLNMLRALDLRRITLLMTKKYRLGSSSSRALSMLLMLDFLGALSIVYGSPA